jgi:hypothetical protein
MGYRAGIAIMVGTAVTIMMSSVLVLTACILLWAVFNDQSWPLIGFFIGLGGVVLGVGLLGVACVADMWSEP